MGAAGGGEGKQKDRQQARHDQDYSQAGGNADGLKGAVGYAEADKVSVRAVLKQLVNVVGNGFKVGRVRGRLDVGEDLGAHMAGDIELLGRPGKQKCAGDGEDLVPVCVVGVAVLRQLVVAGLTRLGVIDAGELALGAARAGCAGTKELSNLGKNTFDCTSADVDMFCLGRGGHVRCAGIW